MLRALHSFSSNSRLSRERKSHFRCWMAGSGWSFPYHSSFFAQNCSFSERKSRKIIQKMSNGPIQQSRETDVPLSTKETKQSKESETHGDETVYRDSPVDRCRPGGARRRFFCACFRSKCEQFSLSRADPKKAAALPGGAGAFGLAALPPNEDSGFQKQRQPSSTLALVPHERTLGAALRLFDALSHGQLVFV